MGFQMDRWTRAELQTSVQENSNGRNTSEKKIKEKKEKEKK